MTAQASSQIVSSLQAFFQSEPKESVELAYLFGSHATGNAGPLSDVDVAVFLSPSLQEQERFDVRLSLLGDLLNATGQDRVDLILLNEASLLMQHRVIAKGMLLFEKSASIRVRYETGVLRHYLDFQPTSDLHYQYMRKRIQEGTYGCGRS